MPSCTRGRWVLVALLALPVIAVAGSARAPTADLKRQFATVDAAHQEWRQLLAGEVEAEPVYWREVHVTEAMRTAKRDQAYWAIRSDWPDQGFRGAHPYDVVAGGGPNGDQFTAYIPLDQAAAEEAGAISAVLSVTSFAGRATTTTLPWPRVIVGVMGFTADPAAAAAFAAPPVLQIDGRDKELIENNKIPPYGSFESSFSQRSYAFSAVYVVDADPFVDAARARRGASVKIGKLTVPLGPDERRAILDVLSRLDLD